MKGVALEVMDVGALEAGRDEPVVHCDGALESA